MYDKYLGLRLITIGVYLISTILGSQSVWSPNYELPIERREFRKLLANNPNFFDGLHTSHFEPTMYEQLVCIGYNTTLGLIEATVEIKLSTGFDGSLCTNGSTEYVRFYVDYGSGEGWQNLGISTLNTHDVLNGDDCEKQSEKPLFYSVATQFQPPQANCSIHVLPNIRAILSWEEAPPPDQSNWIPTWGNVLDQHVQSPPLPPPNPPSSAHEQSTSRGSEILHTCQFNPDKDSNTNAPSAIVTRAEDLSSRPQGPNTNYEELIGLGLDYDSDRLVATVRIKQSKGYGSGLCDRGALEYVSFWADWNDSCTWTLLGTQTINVHDISNMPHDGLTYSAVLPVDLQQERTFCNTTKVARIRAALSFDSPPPEPPELPKRGNFLIKHVQLQPFTNVSDMTAFIDSIGNVNIVSIDWAATGKTLAGATFNYPPYFTDPKNRGRGCPFGGQIIVTGSPIGGPDQYSYRLWARNDDGHGLPVTNDITVLDTTFHPAKTVTYTPSSKPVGYLPYITNPNKNFGNVLSSWTPQSNGLWQIRLEVASTSTYTHVGYSPWYNILVNNIFPNGTLEPTSGSPCGDFVVGKNITGTFWVDAQYLAFWEFRVPPGFHISTTGSPPPSEFSNVPGPPGSGWTMSTDAAPCGYIVSLYIEDLTVWNSLWEPGMYIHKGFRFCLRD
jgi:hypothetical protein